MSINLPSIIVILSVLLINCTATASEDTIDISKLSEVIRNAELPEKLANKIYALAEDSAFIADMFVCLNGDKYLRELVDKQHSLPKDYTPDDLVTLEDGDYQLVRKGSLRQVAAKSLGEMSAAARADGIVLIVSSTYRTYDYQVTVYNRNVQNLGKKNADRESARPGFSQHQTGLVVDFYPVTDLLAKTRAGRWLATNASRFGWSISYPNGYEAVTGYKWENWHYRYVGLDLTHFIDNYFEGVQQYALRFLHEWELVKP